MLLGELVQQLCKALLLRLALGLKSAGLEVRAKVDGKWGKPGRTGTCKDGLDSEGCLGAIRMGTAASPRTSWDCTSLIHSKHPTSKLGMPLGMQEKRVPLAVEQQAWPRMQRSGRRRSSVS